jgi:hypothetical protein
LNVVKRAWSLKTTKNGGDFEPKCLEYGFETFRSFLTEISTGCVLPKILNRNNLTYQKRLGLVHFLLQRDDNDTLDWGALAHGAAFVSVRGGTVSTLWKGWCLKHTASLKVEWDLTFEKKNKSGTFKYVPDEFVRELEGTAILK